MAWFVYEKIVTQFKILLKMVPNNGPQITNNVVKELMRKLTIIHHVTTTYKSNIVGEVHE
jgi:hypothetical protein